jgi:hypothetical protein
MRTRRISRWRMSCLDFNFAGLFLFVFVTGLRQVLGSWRSVSSCGTLSISGRLGVWKEMAFLEVCMEGVASHP